MKRILAIALMLTFVLTAMIFTSSAVDQDYCVNLTVDENGIKCYSGLDFNAKNNIWAKYDEETGKWGDSGLRGKTYTDGDNTYYVIDDTNNETYTVYENGIFKTYTYDQWSDHEVYGETWDVMNNAFPKGFTTTTTYTKHLDFSLSNDSEYITFTAIDSSAIPGYIFTIDESGTEIQVGGQDDATPKPEYVAIRYRNWSSASVMSFGFVTTSTNGGNAFMGRTVTDVPSTPNSGEWVKTVISMKEYNSYMENEENKGGDAWNGTLKMFLIFPFGYNKTDGTGSYETAQMDIDYLVIGSKEYCENYQSEIEKLEASVTSAKLKSAPTKNVYYVGETLDLDGLQIDATYEDGTSETVSDCSFIQYDFTTPSNNSVVTLKYGSNTKPMSFAVKVIGIDSIEVESEPDETTYKVSDVANGITTSCISGLKMKINYADGTTESIVPQVKNLEISSTDVGDQIVTINYYGAKATFACKVINVTGIVVEAPNKTFHYGDTISKDDFTVKCVFSDGQELSLSDSGMTDSLQDIDVDSHVIGELPVTVRVYNEAYGVDVSETVTVTVAAPVTLSVATMPDKTTYQPDDQLDTTGLVMEYIYEDGTHVAVQDQDYTTKYDFSEPGTKTVKVTSNGLEAVFDVTVEGAATRASRATTSTDKPAQSGGCGSVIGMGSIVVVATLALAGAVIIKKKED